MIVLVMAGVLAKPWTSTEHGDALVLLGVPGIDKSSLVAAASAKARASGFQILTATGVQSEAELPFAGLHQLTRAVQGDVDSLPSPQREAMLAAFGRTSSAAPDLFLIALAALDPELRCGCRGSSGVPNIVGPNRNADAGPRQDGSLGACVRGLPRWSRVDGAPPAPYWGCYLSRASATLLLSLHLGHQQPNCG